MTHWTHLGADKKGRNLQSKPLQSKNDSYFSSGAMRSLLMNLTACLLCFIFSPCSEAQVPIPVPSSSDAQLQEESAPEEPLPVYFTTPRKSYKRFMDAMGKSGGLSVDNYVLASKHLDLGEKPSSGRLEQGVLFSQNLYQILIYARINIENISDDPEASSPYKIYQTSGMVSPIEMVRLKDGAWKFSGPGLNSVVDYVKVLGLPEFKPPASQHDEGLFYWLDQLFHQKVSIASLLGVALFGWFAGFLLSSFLTTISRQSIESLSGNDDIFDRVKLWYPLRWLGVGCTVWFFMLLNQDSRWFDKPLLFFSKLTVLVSLITIAYRAIDVLSYLGLKVAKRTDTQMDEMLVPMLEKVSKFFVLFLGGIFIAQNMGLNVWSLFAGFSVLGAMIALAGQDLIKNVFGAITVLSDGSFQLGDWIATDGVEGVVQEVGIRSTRVRTFYDSEVMVPNARFVSAIVDNYGKRLYRRYTSDIYIPYETSSEVIEAFVKGVRELIDDNPAVRPGGNYVVLNDFDRSSLKVMIYLFWLVPTWEEELQARHDFILSVKELAESLGLGFAYPTNRLLMSEEKTKTSLDEVVVSDNTAESLTDNNQEGPGSNKKQKGE